MRISIFLFFIALFFQENSLAFKTFEPRVLYNKREIQKLTSSQTPLEQPQAWACENKTTLVNIHTKLIQQKAASSLFNCKFEAQHLLQKGLKFNNLALIDDAIYTCPRSATADKASTYLARYFFHQENFLLSELYTDLLLHKKSSLKSLFYMAQIYSLLSRKEKLRIVFSQIEEKKLTFIRFGNKNLTFAQFKERVEKNSAFIKQGLVFKKHSSKKIFSQLLNRDNKQRSLYQRAIRHHSADKILELIQMPLKFQCFLVAPFESVLEDFVPVTGKKSKLEKDFTYHLQSFFKKELIHIYAQGLSNPNIGIRQSNMHKLSLHLANPQTLESFSHKQRNLFLKNMAKNLKHDNPHLRLQTIRALNSINKQALKPILPYIIESLQDSRYPIIHQSILTLRKIGKTREALPALIKLLKHEDENIVAATQRLIIKWHTISFPYLNENPNHPSPLIRQRIREIRDEIQIKFGYEEN